MLEQNNVDPNQTAPKEQSDLGLECFPKEVEMIFFQGKQTCLNSKIKDSITGITGVQIFPVTMALIFSTKRIW